MAMSAADRDFLPYLQRPFDVLVVHLGRGQVRFERHLGGKRGKTLRKPTLNDCILLYTFFIFLFGGRNGDGRYVITIASGIYCGNDKSVDKKYKTIPFHLLAFFETAHFKHRTQKKHIYIKPYFLIKKLKKKSCLHKYWKQLCPAWCGT